MNGQKIDGQASSVSSGRETRGTPDGANNAGGAGSDDWRMWLRNFAHLRWIEAINALSAGKPPPRRAQSAALAGRSPPSRLAGELGEEAIRIIDRFAMGAAAEAVAEGQSGQQPGIAFDSQLDVITEGLERRIGGNFAERAVRKVAEEPSAPPQSFQSELWQLLHKVRESAELSYARDIDLVELDRRILFLLRTLGPTVPAGISASVGVDKAQVSRSVKRLLELRMVERIQIRSPITLTRKGENTADRLLRHAELRNRELSFDIGDRELEEFFRTIEVLLDRAIALYEQERGRCDAPSTGEPEPGYVIHERKSGEKLAIDRSRIVSPLLTLSAYISRSAALAFKRLTNLSNFEAWVLSEISIDPPTDWSKLVQALERDHSQAGRTVNVLIEKGLVIRDGKPGRRHGRFSPTQEGARIYSVIYGMSLKRGSFLMASIQEEKLKEFLATFDKVRRNAAAQLERERAFEELERG